MVAKGWVYRLSGNETSPSLSEFLRGFAIVFSLGAVLALVGSNQLFFTNRGGLFSSPQNLAAVICLAMGIPIMAIALIGLALRTVRFYRNRREGTSPHS
jgi:hypothetical protein